MKEQPAEFTPPVVSMTEDELGRGFTFLRRALSVAVANPTRSVIINTHGLNVTYVHSDEHSIFSDGVTCVELKDGITAESMRQARQTMRGFNKAADVYSVRQGLAELALTENH